MLKSHSFKTKTIVVGNLSVGGTGKTPQIEYLIRMLKDVKQIAVLSRGYKRKSTGFILASEKATAVSLGDEPYQYFRKFKNILVCVDSNRVRAIQKLEAYKKKSDVILLDDAYQHRKVQGGFNILLTSFDKLFYNDYVLPTGDLRESRSGANRAQAIVVTKCPDEFSSNEQAIISAKISEKYQKPVFFTKISYAESVQGASEITLEALKEYRVLLVTGIAKPKPLVSFLKGREISFDHLEFPDHHDFTKKELESITDKFQAINSKRKIILTTEKDYVRIFAKLKNLHYLEIETAFISKELEFKNLISNYVG